MIIDDEHRGPAISPTKELSDYVRCRVIRADSDCGGLWSAQNATRSPIHQADLLRNPC